MRQPSGGGPRYLLMKENQNNYQDLNETIIKR